MGKDILQGLLGTTEKAKETIQENAVAPLQRIKDARPAKPCGPATSRTSPPARRRKPSRRSGLA
jgi:hypothetical protein